jgi:hypothetical protein
MARRAAVLCWPTGESLCVFGDRRVAESSDELAKVGDFHLGN